MYPLTSYTLDLLILLFNCIVSDVMLRWSAFIFALAALRTSEPRTFSEDIIVGEDEHCNHGYWSVDSALWLTVFTFTRSSQYCNAQHGCYSAKWAMQRNVLSSVKSIWPLLWWRVVKSVFHITNIMHYCKMTNNFRHRQHFTSCTYRMNFLHWF